MKQKIKSALDKAYKAKLGLGEEAIERAATLGSTFITSEEQIESFVNAAEAMLKAEQSAADKVRTELNAKIKGIEGEKAALEAKLKGNQPEAVLIEEPQKETPNLVDIVAQAVQAAISPLQEKFTAFETAQTQKSAIAALDELRSSWDYAKGYPDESDYAYNMALGIYNGIGKTWTAEQLTAEYKKTFNERVSKKGVDTTKPFNGGGGAEDEIQSRFDAMAKRQKERQGEVAGK